MDEVILAFYCGIVHDVKNYLAAVHADAEETERKSRSIMESVRETNCFIDNLVVHLKSLSQKQPLKLEPRSLANDIKDAIASYNFIADEAELITKDLAQDFTYTGDSYLTEHLLHNLLKNALTAIKISGRGVITMQLEHGSKYNKLIFSNTASGITTQFLPHIFELFATNAYPKTNSNGIGLAWCQTIMKLYGGKISCRSSNNYTEFTLLFPRRH